MGHEALFVCNHAYKCVAKRHRSMLRHHGTILMSIVHKDTNKRLEFYKHIIPVTRENPPYYFARIFTRGDVSTSGIIYPSCYFARICTRGGVSTSGTYPLCYFAMICTRGNVSTSGIYPPYYFAWISTPGMNLPDFAIK